MSPTRAKIIMIMTLTLLTATACDTLFWAPRPTPSEGELCSQIDRGEVYAPDPGEPALRCETVGLFEEWVDIGVIDTAGDMQQDMTDEDMPAQRRVIESVAYIGQETWRAADNVLLDGAVRVRGGASLTIEEGSVIEATPRGVIVVERGGEIIAKGTRDAPIVFTAAIPSSNVRSPGSWGGILMAGNAPTTFFNGADLLDFTVFFGGDEPDSSCGTLEYVRIEFAGGEVVAAGGESSFFDALALYGCGTGTVVDHVQVHKAFSDALDIVGGTVVLRHVVASFYGDDAIDYDAGWTGGAQFLVAYADRDGDNALDGEHGPGPGELPVSSPTFFNVTVSGVPGSQPDAGAALLSGAYLVLGNSIMVQLDKYAINLRDPGSVAAFQDMRASFSHALLFQIGDAGMNPFELEDMDEDMLDGMFDEPAYFAQPGFALDSSIDPMLTDITNRTAPNFKPMNAEAAKNTPLRPPNGIGFDQNAGYMGAVDPDADGGGWLDGWTSFPLL